MRCLIWPTSSQRNIDRQLKFVCWIFLGGGYFSSFFYVLCYFVIAEVQRCRDACKSSADCHRKSVSAGKRPALEQVCELSPADVVVEMRGGSKQIIELVCKLGASIALGATSTAHRCVFSRRPKLAMLRSGSRRSLLSAFQTVGPTTAVPTQPSAPPWLVN